MTPKEKAKELENRFYIQMLRVTPALNRPHHQAKECSLICVDEVLRIIIFASTPKCHLHEEQTFWSQVKEEIQKL